MYCVFVHQLREPLCVILVGVRIEVCSRFSLKNMEEKARVVGLAWTVVQSQEQFWIAEISGDCFNAEALLEPSFMRVCQLNHDTRKAWELRINL